LRLPVRPIGISAVEALERGRGSRGPGRCGFPGQRCWRRRTSSADCRLCRPRWNGCMWAARRWWLATEKAKSQLGWTPKYTAVETLSASGEAI